MYIRVLFVTLFLGILAFIVSKTINFPELITLLKDFPKLSLVSLFGLSFLISVLKAGRFYMLLKRNDIHLPFGKTLRAFMASQAMTPLPGGEAGRSMLLKKEMDVRMRDSYGAVVTQAFQEIFAAGIMALLGTIFFPQFFIPILITCIVLIGFIAMILHKKFISVFEHIFSKWKKVKLTSKKLVLTQEQMKKNIFSSSSLIPNKIFILTFIVAMFSHMLGGLIIFIIAQAFGANLDFFKSIFVYSASIIIQAATTFSPGGIGFTEGGMSGILVVTGINFSKAVAIVVVFRFVTLLFAIFLGVLFLGYIYAKPFITNKLFSKKFI